MMLLYFFFFFTFYYHSLLLLHEFSRTLDAAAHSDAAAGDKWRCQLGTLHLVTRFFFSLKVVSTFISVPKSVEFKLDVNELDEDKTKSWEM